MPRIYVFGLMLFAVSAVLFFAPSPKYAMAQADCPDGWTEVDGTCISNEDIAAEEAASQEAAKQENSGPVLLSDPNATTGGMIAGSQSANQILEKIKCDGWSEFVSHFGSCVLWSIGSEILVILVWVAGLSAKLLDFAIQFNLDIGNYLKEANGITVVWATIRDLANLLFIFFLLWISIETILGLGHGVAKALPSIIIAALLINFSMFFTRVIIDTSNIVALQFYAGVTGPPVNGVQETAGTGILNALRIQGMFNENSPIDGAVDFSSLLIAIVLSSIFVAVAIFAFLNVAFMFIARVLIFIVLIATSPLAFISAILPDKMQTFHKMWWSNMWNQALVAPVFLLMLWVIVKVASTLPQSQMSGSGKLSILDVILPGSGSGSDMSPIFNFLILIGLLIAAVKITKHLSGQAGGLMTTFGATAVGAVLGGAGGFALRNTLGRASNMISRSERVKNWAEAKNPYGRFAGQTLFNAARKGSRAAYDVRAATDSKFGKAVTGVAGAAGVNVNFGKATGKGGAREAYDQRMKAAKDKGEAYLKDLEARKDRDDLTPEEKRAAKERVVGAAERMKESGTIFAGRIPSGYTFSPASFRGSKQAGDSYIKQKKKEEKLEAEVKRLNDMMDALAETLTEEEKRLLEGEDLREKLMKKYENEITAINEAITAAADAGNEKLEKAQERALKKAENKLSKFERMRDRAERLSEQIDRNSDKDKSKEKKDDDKK